MVSIIDFFNTFIEKLLFKLLNIIEPNAPTEAASVGVATPANIEPNTAIIKIIGGKIILKILIIFPFVYILETAGQLSGLIKINKNCHKE